MIIIPLEYSSPHINGFVAKHSDGWIKTTRGIDVSKDNVGVGIFIKGEPVAVGFIRGWNEDWNDKVIGLIVHTDHRGKGYGRLLLHYLEVMGRGRGLKRLRLHVHPDNHVARRMYERDGWYPYGRRENREIIMYRVLKN